MGKTYDEYAEAAIRLTREIVEKHGPRVSGTKGCLEACDELKRRLSLYCSGIEKDPFDLHPDSLFAIGKIFRDER